MAFLPIEKCIRYWERTLFHDKFLMDISVQVIVGATINYLKELKQIKENNVKPTSR